jgi:hypothetical protein
VKRYIQNKIASCQADGSGTCVQPGNHVLYLEAQSRETNIQPPPTYQYLSSPDHADDSTK